MCVSPFPRLSHSLCSPNLLSALNPPSNLCKSQIQSRATSACFFSTESSALDCRSLFLCPSLLLFPSFFHSFFSSSFSLSPLSLVFILSPLPYSTLLFQLLVNHTPSHWPIATPPISEFRTLYILAALIPPFSFFFIIFIIILLFFIYFYFSRLFSFLSSVSGVFPARTWESKTNLTALCDFDCILLLLLRPTPSLTDTISLSSLFFSHTLSIFCLQPACKPPTQFSFFETCYYSPWLESFEPSMTGY